MSLTSTTPSQSEPTGPEGLGEKQQKSRRQGQTATTHSTTPRRNKKPLIIKIRVVEKHPTSRHPSTMHDGNHALGLIELRRNKRLAYRVINDQISHKTLHSSIYKQTSSHLSN